MERQNAKASPPLTWHRWTLAWPWPALPACPCSRAAGAPTLLQSGRGTRLSDPASRPASCPRRSPPEHVPRPQATAARTRESGGGGGGPWTVRTSRVTETTVGGGRSTRPHPGQNRRPWRRSCPPRRAQSTPDVTWKRGRRHCPRRRWPLSGPETDSVWVSKARASPTSRRVVTNERPRRCGELRLLQPRPGARPRHSACVLAGGEGHSERRRPPQRVSGQRRVPHPCPAPPEHTPCHSTGTAPKSLSCVRVPRPVLLVAQRSSPCTLL